MAKGQTQAVTAIMITGIIVGAAASAYVWGAPLIEKRQSAAELQNIESKVMGIEKSITNVARSGTGSSSQIDLSLDNGEVEVNTEGNYIDLVYFTRKAPYPKGTWRLLKGSNRQGTSIGTGEYGIKGEDAAGIVAVKRDSADSSVRYRIEFRDMRTTSPSGPKLEKIDLVLNGEQTEVGEVEIGMRNRGRETDSVSGFNTSKSQLTRTRRIVEIDLR